MKLSDNLKPTHFMSSIFYFTNFSSTLFSLFFLSCLLFLFSLNFRYNHLQRWFERRHWPVRHIADKPEAIWQEPASAFRRPVHSCLLPCHCAQCWQYRRGVNGRYQSTVVYFHVTVLSANSINEESMVGISLPRVVYFHVTVDSINEESMVRGNQ